MPGSYIKSYRILNFFEVEIEFEIEFENEVEIEFEVEFENETDVEVEKFPFVIPDLIRNRILVSSINFSVC
ncbi:hypothetical protein GCM10008088_12120 [Mesonia mobilis]|uniref:Uncharacterized protein n=1 Tax=Mesonia mobilis TaxID=369791 RepID=A0ABQ3BR01_9FLAO|nr:hypothetical protein GCM10008088_12120 [Mesonia mobilis]